MKRILTLVVIFWSSLAAQVSYNVDLYGHMDKYQGIGSNNNDYSEVWGWSDTANHREYAIIGTSLGTSIVDITDSLKEVSFHYGPRSLYNYHEFRTYLNYLYIGSEGTDTSRRAGIQIIDLSTLPDSGTFVKVFIWIDSTLSPPRKYYRSHTMNAEGKYLYANGGEFGGIRIFDLTDPVNPRQVSTYGNSGTSYVHDSFTRNDTIYAACITAGNLRILDARNKKAIATLSTVATVPEGRTHNVWTTADGKYAFVATEVTGGHLHIYDAHDPTDPNEIATWTSNPSASIHNVLINGEFAYIAYYSEGLRILDITNPSNPIEVGFYDTHPGPIATTFEGAWGVYPFFPSGKIAISDMNTGLYVFTFNKKHGGQLTGTVRSSSDNRPLDSVSVTVLEMGRTYVTNLAGVYKFGGAEGTLTVRYSKKGFMVRTDSVSVHAGKVDTVDFFLTPNTAVVAKEAMIPHKIELSQSYPNPFNGRTIIRYRLAESGFVVLDVFDVLGRCVATLVNEKKDAGEHSTIFDAASLPSGIYFYKLAVGSFIQSRPMALVR